LAQSIELVLISGYRLGPNESTFYLRTEAESGLRNFVSNKSTTMDNVHKVSNSRKTVNCINITVLRNAGKYLFRIRCIIDGEKNSKTQTYLEVTKKQKHRNKKVRAAAAAAQQQQQQQE
jgi:hypothetical protein